MKVIINGSNGRMGKEVVKQLLAGYKNAELAAAVDVNNAGIKKYPVFEHLADFEGDADCIIDFTNHIATRGLLEYAVKRHLPTVIATTGHTEEELAVIKKASEEIPIFHSANMSVGIALLVELAKTTAKMLPDADIEIIEKHHNRKLDAPSGTALLIADGIKEIRQDSTYIFGREGHRQRTKEEIGIHAVRVGNIIGEHEVIVGTDTQTVTLRHEAHDRSLFAEGAVTAAAFLVHMPCGLYNMKDMINN